MGRILPMARSKVRKGLEDAQAKAYAKSAAASFKEGTFKASQTGARQLAEKREQFRQMGKISDSMGSQGEMEEYISGKSYKGKKRP